MWGRAGGGGGTYPGAFSLLLHALVEAIKTDHQALLLCHQLHHTDWCICCAMTTNGKDSCDLPCLILYNSSISRASFGTTSLTWRTAPVFFACSVLLLVVRCHMPCSEITSCTCTVQHIQLENPADAHPTRPKRDLARSEHHLKTTKTPLEHH